MIRNYLRTALRNLSRERVFAAVNLAGLAVGIASALLLITFLREEISFDRFHSDADRIYRLISQDSLGGDLMRNANVLGLAAVRYQERIPQIDAAVRMHRERVVVAVGGQLFEEPEFFWTDPNVFEVFDFPLRIGASEMALERPGTVVLSQEMSRKLFGEESPIGRTVLIDSEHELEITGIMEPVPHRSHLRPDFLASLRTLDHITNPWAPELQGWSYLRLIPGADREEVENVMNSVIREVVTWLDLDAVYEEYRLQPLKDIRLHSADIAAPGEVGDVRYVYLFSIITGLILFIACVNFTNLATARSLKRSREVATRKTLGATRHQIAFQFLGESTGLALLASVLAAGLVWLAQPYTARLFGRPIDVDFSGNPELLIWLLVLTIATGLAAGFVPAIFVSGFDPIRTFKGMRGGGRRSMLRSGLVVGQFAIAVGLIFMSLVIARQIRFIQEKNLGYITDGILAIRSEGLGDEQDAFKRLVLETPGVVSASYASGFPLGGGWQSDSEVDGRKIKTLRLLVDEDYIETMGLDLVAGRSYDPDRDGDTESSIIVTESFARLRGWEDPLSSRLAHGIDEDGETSYADVIGVVSDFHTGNMHSDIMPTILDAGEQFASFRRFLIVRLADGSIQSTVSELKSLWTRLVLDKPFSFQFADDYIGAQYEAEKRMGTLFGFFTWLSIGIAGLGLFGLSAYAAERRTKEIGIRKALGASASKISLLLIREYVGLVAISVLIGVPVAWIGAENWLADFAYRTNIPPGVFMLTSIGVVSFAVMAVFTQAMRAALADPIHCLRYE